MDEEKRREQFAKRLKEAREKKGLRQNKLADDISVAPQTLSAYENANKMPTLDNAVALAERLNVSLDWLLGIDQQRDKKSAVPANMADFVRIILAMRNNMVVKDLSVDTITTLNHNPYGDEEDSNEALTIQRDGGAILYRKTYADVPSELLRYHTEAVIRIRDKRIITFFQNLKKIEALKADGILTTEFFDTLVDGEIAKLQNISTSPWYDLEDDNVSGEDFGGNTNAEH